MHELKKGETATNGFAQPKGVFTRAIIAKLLEFKQKIDNTANATDPSEDSK